MLDPEKDRLAFRELFEPEENYRLDFAIGTTYSCDLEALVGACLTFGLMADPEDKVKQSPVACLHALTEAASRLALFCQAGQILRPPRASVLYNLLETTLFQVNPAKKAKYWPSFHPKVWLARYAGNKKKTESQFYYKLAVQSRNLTFDQSWDICCALRSEPGDPGPTNRPLTDFLSFLKDQPACANSPKLKKIGQIIKELKNVKFNADPEKFHRLEFIPLGIPGYKDAMLEQPLLAGWPDGKASVCDELLVISPFLGKTAMQYFCNKKCNQKKILVTRPNSILKIKDLPLDNFAIYVLCDKVANADLEGEESKSREIHAKLYFQRKGDVGRLWLGSMNASYKAISENVEFMCCFYSKRIKLDTLLDELHILHLSADSPFEELHDLEWLEEDAQEIDDSFLREIASAEPGVKIIKDGQSYRPVLRFKKLPAPPAEYEVKISPLLYEEWLPLEQKTEFKAVGILKLSAFYRVRLKTGSASCERILKIPTEGMPGERNGEIIRSILKDKQTFYNYVSILLGENISRIKQELGELTDKGAPAGSHDVAYNGLYEKMLRAAYDNPEKFDELAQLASTLGKENLPEEFGRLVGQFQKALKGQK